jgi:hypothetical protein
MQRTRTLLALTALTTGAIVAACGGGGGGSDAEALGVMRLALTDAPACGYENAYVTVHKVRVHRSAGAADDDGEWSEVVLDPPERVDLLTLTNGVLRPLGQVELPAGTYTQMRLVLAPNTPADPLANAVVPIGGAPVALTTPSGQQSGLKMNVDLEVPAGQVADFAIDFDACKSFVRAGNSGRVLLKPVLRVIPLLAGAPGQRVIGYLDRSLALPTTQVSLQLDGVPVRSTPPDDDGRFELYPVPAGDYDLVIGADGRVAAVMTGVPVADAAPTTVGAPQARLDLPASLGEAMVSGLVTVDGSAVDTGAELRALQVLGDGRRIEIGQAAADADHGGYVLTLPTDAPVRSAYVAGAAQVDFTADSAAAGQVRLQAVVPGFALQERDLSPLGAGPRIEDFAFPAP